RDACSAVLAEARAGPVYSRYPSPPQSWPSGGWPGHGRPAPEEDGALYGGWRDDEPDDWADDDEEEPREAAPPPPRESRRTRWHPALAAGCHATAWWLRRAAGTCSTLAALGVGAVCTGALYVLGAGLTAPALSLVMLA